MKSLSGKDFIIRDLKKKIQTLETENSNIKKRLDEIKKERDFFQHDLEETRKSFSFRLGHTLTAIPRKLRGRN